MSTDRVDELLGDLCAELGFCIPPPDWRRLAEDPPREVERFTDAVFFAEEMDPYAYPELREQVRDMVARHFPEWDGAVDG